jgi:hypothetical protein
MLSMPLGMQHPTEERHFPRSMALLCISSSDLATRSRPWQFYLGLEDDQLHYLLHCLQPSCQRYRQYRVERQPRDPDKDTEEALLDFLRDRLEECNLPLTMQGCLSHAFHGGCEPCQSLEEPLTERYHEHKEFRDALVETICMSLIAHPMTLMKNKTRAMMRSPMLRIHKCLVDNLNGVTPSQSPLPLNVIELLRNQTRSWHDTTESDCYSD